MTIYHFVEQPRQRFARGEVELSATPAIFGSFEASLCELLQVGSLASRLCCHTFITVATPSSQAGAHPSDFRRE
jgi:hypothetical protein